MSRDTSTGAAIEITLSEGGLRNSYVSLKPGAWPPTWGPTSARHGHVLRGGERDAGIAGLATCAEERDDEIVADA